MYDLHLFGGASLVGPDGVVSGPVVQRRRLALLALAAASPRGGITRDKAAVFLCPECAAGHSRRHLKDVIYGLRHGLGRDVLLTAGDEVRLNPALVHSDLQRFREALERNDLEAAAAAYTGPFLDGFSVPDAPEFGRWADEQRAYWARAYGRALGNLAQARAAAGDPAGAAAWWGRLAAQEPYSSRVALELMRSLAAAGDRSAALHHAHVHEAAMREMLGVEPDAEVAALAERLRREGAADRPASSSAGGARGGSGGAACDVAAGDRRRVGDVVAILGISGSLRTASTNTAVLAAAASLVPEDVEVGLFAELDTLPFFNPDFDGEGMAPPPSVAEFRRRAVGADALLICSPEYAHGVPGALKNALDWLVSVPELVEKPVGLLNASPHSTHAHASLAETLRTMSLTLVPEACLTLAAAGRGLDAAAIAADAELAAALRGALAALGASARAQRARALA